MRPGDDSIIDILRKWERRYRYYQEKKDGFFVSESSRIEAIDLQQELKSCRDDICDLFGLKKMWPGEGEMEVEND